MDRYNERLIKGTAGFAPVLLIVLGVLLLCASVAIVLFYPNSALLMLVCLMIGGGCVLIHFSRQALSVEFEYILTNGDIEISKILSKSRRKLITEIAASSIVKVDRADSDKTRNDLSLGKTKVRKYVGKEQQGTMVAVYAGEGDKATIYVLDMDDKCIEHLKGVLKSKCEIR